MPRKGKSFLGFGRSLGEILPSTLSELPKQLRDLRNNQKSLKPYFSCSKTTPNTPSIFPYKTGMTKRPVSIWPIEVMVMIAKCIEAM